MLVWVPPAFMSSSGAVGRIWFAFCASEQSLPLEEVVVDMMSAVAMHSLLVWLSMTCSFDQELHFL